jgi:predicted AlkP superfamily phosphohydrolase/phosphomutase
MFIGLDAADKDLLNRMAEEGKAPNWKRLLDQGLSGTTNGPAGFYVGAIWPTFYTGVNPARHGHHCWEQIVPGSYEVQRYLAGANATHEAFWDVLSRAGIRSAIVDVPLSGPAHHLHGLQIIEWGCHDPELGLVTVPPELAVELTENHGLHPIQGNCNQHGRTSVEFAAFRDALVDGAAAKTNLNLSLLARDRFDLFLTIYSESHCAGHQCWHLHDVGHERHDPSVAEITGDIVSDVYSALDHELGRMIEATGPGTTLIVWASHGMGAHNDGTFMLDEILRRLEIANLSKGRHSLLDLVFPRRSNARRHARGKTLTIPHRKFYPHPNNREEAGIRINLAGREPNGLVQPGRDFDALCENLAADMLDLVDEKSGQSIVRNVLRTRDHYEGEYLSQLPDLIIQWTNDFPVRSARSRKIGVISGTCPSCRTGGHRPEGQFIATGPGIAGGRLTEPVNVMDFAPTIAALLGVKLDGVDGRVVSRIAPHAQSVTTDPSLQSRNNFLPGR